MTLFYRSFITSVLSLCIVAWFGSVNLAKKNKPGPIVEVASKVIGLSQLAELLKDGSRVPAQMTV